MCVFSLDGLEGKPVPSHQREVIWYILSLDQTSLLILRYYVVYKPY